MNKDHDEEYFYAEITLQKDGCEILLDDWGDCLKFKIKTKKRCTYEFHFGPGPEPKKEKD